MKLRIHHRIALPFALIAFFMTAALAAVALSLIQRTLETRVLTQVRSTAAVVARGDFALNGAILRTVKEIAGTDVITCADNGAIVATSLPPERAAALLEAIGGPTAIANALSRSPTDPAVSQGTCSGVPCYAALTPVASRPDTVVAAIVRTDEIQVATRAIARALVLSALIVLVVMVLVSQLIARRVTTPIERLVEFTRAATPGSSPQRAKAGDDEVGRLAGAFNDMLERLERTQDALVKSEKLAVAGLLAARVAHDIRNPLSSIKMQTQLLQAQAATPAERQLVGAVLHDVDQVETVIRGLLELARPGALRLADANVNDILDHLLQRLAPQCAHRRLRVVTRLDRTMPPLHIDATRLEQAVLNVVLNAADAMPHGGTLEVTTEMDHATGQAIIGVCDDGSGIDPALLSHVFDPFVSTKRDGVGLGLVNTKAIVEQHGGTIAIAARVPRGTAVHIALPLRPPPERAAASV